MFLGMGRPAWREARATLQKILSGSCLLLLLLLFTIIYILASPFSLFLLTTQLGCNMQSVKKKQIVIVFSYVVAIDVDGWQYIQLQDGTNYYSFFFPCCFAADEPVLRDNEALRNKCLVPMVSFLNLLCHLF